MKEPNIKDLITNYKHLRARLDKVNASIDERADELAQFYIGKSMIIYDTNYTWYLYNVNNIEFDRDGVLIQTEKCYKTWSKEIETGYNSYKVECWVGVSTPYIRKIALYQYMCENKFVLAQKIFNDCSNEELIEKLVELTGIQEFRSLPSFMKDQKWKEEEY